MADASLNDEIETQSSTSGKFKWLDWVSIAVFLWLVVYPHPYNTVFTIALILPIFGLILKGSSHPNLASLVSISNKKDEDKFSLAGFIFFPGCALLIRVLSDYECESFYTVLEIGTIGFILVLFLLFARYSLIEKTNKNRFWIYLIAIGNIAIYSYSATFGINCVFDRSKPVVYNAEVVDKSSSGTRHTTYYLKVAPWGNHTENENITVAQSQYNSTEIGQTVKVDYKKGLLGIPWYYIE